MSEARTIDQLFSPEAQGVRLVKALVEFYKASSPDTQADLGPGVHTLVSVIQKRLTDGYVKKTLADFLEEEGMVPLMRRWEQA